MFNKRSDFALNKVDKAAIVCQSVTGDHVRLTREDFSSEEEFVLWKNWSDCDYQEIDRVGRFDDECLSFDAQRDTSVPSAEDIVLSPYTVEEQVKRQQRLEQVIKKILTPKQYRRLCMYYIDGKDEAEIAKLENVNQSSVSRSISKGTKIVERFFEKFL